MIEINQGHRLTQVWNQGVMECDLCDEQGECILILTPPGMNIGLNICRACWDKIQTLWSDSTETENESPLE